MRVLKFGGKSLESKEKVQKICKNIKKIYKNDKNLIIVVSAMGNQTNLLLEKAKDFSSGKTKQRELALFVSTGEIQSACLFSMMLNSIGVPSVALTSRDINLRTFGGYQDATIYYLNKSKIQKFLENGQVAVICGFQGVNELGETTTLGRGGSDTTAVALASAFSVPAEIYSDFDGVFCGDPRLMHYKKINQISFPLMKLMAMSGAKVIDSHAAQIADEHNTVIISKSAENFEAKGTVISKITDDFISISKTENLSLITIVFSNTQNLERISKNVLKLIKLYKIYNLKIKETKLELLVSSNCCSEVIGILSKKLGLIKKQD